MGNIDVLTPDSVCYLSGPMTGYPEYNFPAFEEAAQVLRAKGLTILSAHEIEHPDDGAAGSLPWEEYLRVDLREMLDKANCIILLPYWYNSSGSQLEAMVAHKLNWPTFFYRDRHLDDREGRLVL